MYIIVNKAQLGPALHVRMYIHICTIVYVLTYVSMYVCSQKSKLCMYVRSYIRIWSCV